MTDYAYKTCPVCGIHYALDKIVNDRNRNADPNQKDTGWYCPNGHYLVFTDSVALKERRRAERAEQLLAYERDRAAEAERRTAAYKGQVTKLKKRASAGTCPCCNRTFQQLARHMKNKHPDFAKLELKVVTNA